MNESYRLGEQSIIAHLQRLANGTSTAELDVAALPTELRSIGEQLQKTLAVLQQERQLLERSAYVDSLTNSWQPRWTRPPCRSALAQRHSLYLRLY